MLLYVTLYFENADEDKARALKTLMQESFEKKRWWWYPEPLENSECSRVAFFTTNQKAFTLACSGMKEDIIYGFEVYRATEN